MGSVGCHRGLPVEPFQDAILALVASGDATYCNVAYEMGMRRKGRRGPGLVGDSTMLKRMMGLAHYSHYNRRSDGELCRNRYMSIANASRLCEILDLDPVDMGL